MRRGRLWTWHQVTVSLMVYIFAVAASAAGDEAVVPAGSDIGPVQFDSVMELEAPVGRTTTVLFARYWVLGSSYRAEIIWAEPHWMAVNYAAYPVSLCVLSTDSGLTILNSIRKEKWQRPKPVGPRGVFTAAFNDYDPLDMGFAESTARAMSPSVTGISRGIPRGTTDGVIMIPSSQRAAGPNSLVLRLEEGRLGGIDVVGQRKEILKSISYTYSGDRASAQLCRLTAVLPQETITVSPGEATLTINGKKQTYDKWQARYHRGGRQCVIDFADVKLGDRDANLPTLMEVRNAADGTLLRRARIMDYQPIGPALAGVLLSPEPTAFSSYSADQELWRRMAVKYRYAPTERVVPEDRVELERLRRIVATSCDTSGATIGGRFRRIHMLAMIGLILGDDNTVLSLFEEHCGLLRSNGLSRIIIPSGAKMLELCLRWDRIDFCDKLIDCWTAAAAAANDMQTLTAAIRKLNEESRFWPAYNLAKAVLAANPQDERARFELEYQTCTALLGLHGCITKGAQGEYELLDMETAWAVRRTTSDGMHKEIEEHSAALREAFSRMPTPSKSDARRKQLVERSAEILN